MTDSIAKNFKPGQVWSTRLGERVRIRATDYGHPYSICADGFGWSQVCMKNGRRCPHKETDYDLVNLIEDTQK